MLKYSPASIKKALMPVVASFSLQYLLKNKEVIKKHSSAEDLVFSKILSPKEISACEYHFVKVRNEILKALWGIGIYLGSSLIEEIVFLAVQADTPFYKEIISIITTNNLHEKGVILYPLHSFGILGIGLRDFFSEDKSCVEMPKQGIIVHPQANNEDLIFRRLERALQCFSIKGEIDKGVLLHYLRSRQLNWVRDNPLLFLSARAFQGDYFANHFAIKLKLVLAKGYLLFLHVHSRKNSPESQFTSSSTMNNFETLDIKHYLILQPKTDDKKSYDVRCVPMNAEPNEMAELSELNADLNPREWMRRSPYAESIKTVFDSVEAGIVTHTYFNSTHANRNKVYSKLEKSIIYFNKSFRKSEKKEDAVVMLSIAFETLLLDCYSAGVAQKLQRRVRLALKGQKGSRSFKNVVGDLYNARCEIVHSGFTEIDIDLRFCQQVFSRCWVKIGSLANTLPSKGIGNPIGVLIGDK